MTILEETPPAASKVRPVLDVIGLGRRFGAVEAVRDLHFTVERGDVVALLGPNGAGKSTSMRMIAGYLRPSAGRVTIAGHDVQTHPGAARRHLGYLPEGAPLYEEMTPAALLDFVGRTHRLTGRERRTRIESVVGRLALESVMEKPVGALSKGFRRRLALAAAILHDPALLILDEPTDGLDPNQKFEVRRLLADLRRDRAVLVSTHLLEEVAAMCTRAIVIAEGQIVTDTTPGALQARGPLDQVFRDLTAPRSERTEVAEAPTP